VALLQLWLVLERLEPLRVLVDRTRFAKPVVRVEHLVDVVDELLHAVALQQTPHDKRTVAQNRAPHGDGIERRRADLGHDLAREQIVDRIG
jgi:hypothetical protein